MEGFRINLKEISVQAALKEGNLHIITIVDKDTAELSFSGDTVEEHCVWYSSELGEEEDFSIEIEDIIHNSTPHKLKRKEDEELLQWYNYLKKELTEKGVL